MQLSPDHPHDESFCMQESQSRVHTRPTSLPAPIFTEQDIQDTLTAQIRRVQARTSLTPKDKAELVQGLMMKPWNASLENSVPIKVPHDSEIERLRPTFHNEEGNIFGCTHYQRRCKLRAKCCGHWYACRFCHDDNESHLFDRYTTEEISCLSCNTSQPVSEKCININCQKLFARYFCSICKFYDDDPAKDIYHCEKCKICRIGKGLDIDYFHCDRCNACMSMCLKNHKCVERSLESDCPICNTYMFTSTTPVMFLPCGHCMHVSCYEEYTLTNYICPLCSKSLGDMEIYFASIDELLSQEKMPDEYLSCRSAIYCNDCERKSYTKYHFVYHKCQHEDCKSYNTKVISTTRS